MNREAFDLPPLESPLAQLEHALIDAFVRARGYDPLRLADLSDEVRDALLKDASVHASGRLVEIEARSHYLDDIHTKGDTPRP